MPKVVFFDLDGTLYDNRWMKILMPLGAFRSRRPLRNLRLMAAERSCRRSIARGLAGYDTLFSRMSAKTGVPAAEVREWFSGWYMPLMVRQIARHCKPREGVVARLQALRRDGVRLAILSDYGFIREKLDARGFSKPFWMPRRWVASSLLRMCSEPPASVSVVPLRMPLWLATAPTPTAEVRPWV